jgi:integrase/recombinase XerD
MELLIISNDTRQLLCELEPTLLTALPNTDSTKLKLRFEEIIQNYEITKKTSEDFENDLQEKIDLSLNAVTVEGLSITIIMNYKEELKLFSNYIQKPTVQVTTADIRNYLALNPNLKNSTIATISLNNGIELADLQSLLGQVNPATTLRYAKVSEGRKQNAHKKFVH